MAFIGGARGGVPTLFVGTAATAGSEISSRIDSPSLTTHVRIKNRDGTNYLKVFFSEADFTAGTNFVKVVANEVLSEPWKIKTLWFKADTAAVVFEVVFAAQQG